MIFSSNPATITGTEMAYLHLCRRKLWLFHHGIRPENENVAVQIGRHIGESTFQRAHKELKLGDIGVVDWAELQHGVIHETKKAKCPMDADVAQVRNYWGHHTGSFMPHAEQLSGDLVIAQGQAFRDPEQRLDLCKAIVDAKIHNMLSVLAYYRRRHKDIEDTENRIRELRKQATATDSPDTLMGFEGMSTRSYYAAWKHWLTDAPDKFTRVYHPPDNPLNAMISFLNSMLYTACVSELHRTALYPGISYMHAPQSRRFSLALDLVEPFKPLMVDRLLFRLFNQGDIGKSDFQPHSNGVLLKDEARKRVLQAWDEQLKTTISHPTLNRSVSYRQLLRLDCYKLIKHLLEDADFEPYRIAY